MYSIEKANVDFYHYHLLTDWKSMSLPLFTRVTSMLVLYHLANNFITQMDRYPFC